tara:strand:+ start:111 stop:842 length:732 start_codon:yes stop_codon:yes gene_type:complete
MRYKRRLGELIDLFKDKKKMFFVGLCAITISLNWYLYIWAVNSGYVIEASLGYYINPLAVILLGTLVLKEKLTKAQKIAFVFAFIGVLNLTINYGHFPLVALALATTFALYGLFKKLAATEAFLGLTMETIIITPFAALFILQNEINGVGVVGNVPLHVILLLTTAGIATATPLIFYAQATNTIPLSVVGLLQYVAPTISLFLGVFVFKETFTMTHLISFALIWTGLAYYSVSSWSNRQVKNQ